MYCLYREQNNKLGFNILYVMYFPSAVISLHIFKSRVLIPR